LPAFEGLVVVEGGSDAAALRRAVRTDIFVLGSASTAGSAVTLARLRELSAAQHHAAGVVVLLDPDVAGRQARLALDMALPGCRHAFVPAAMATAARATR
jgi:ribonuclease M5